MELTLEQVTIIGLIATVLIQAIKLISAWMKKEIPKIWVQIIGGLVSIGLGVIWIGLGLGWQYDVAADPWGFLGLILENGVVIFAFATGIYKVLMERVFKSDMLNLTVARFMGVG